MTMNHGSLLLKAVMANLFRRMGRRFLMKRSQLNRKLGLVVESGHGDVDSCHRRRGHRYGKGSIALAAGQAAERVKDDGRSSETGGTRRSVEKCRSLLAWRVSGIRD
jgi:hypothetical protein